MTEYLEKPYLLPTAFNFEIAIPSYDRPEIIKKKTLKLLNDFNVPKNKIRIFLRDDQQLEKYMSVIGNEGYIFHFSGQSGILATRNYLQVYYHEVNLNHDGVLFIDDDITHFQQMGKPLKTDFMKLMQYFFIETRMLGARLWSVSALNNAFFMSETISTSLKYCIGAFKGLILDRTKHTILCDVGHFEDFQFSCEYFLEDGKVVKFNEYGITSKYFELQGGICGELGGMVQRQLEMNDNQKYMIERYHGMCFPKTKKWGADLRLSYAFKNIAL